MCEPHRVTVPDTSRVSAIRRVNGVIERLIRDGTAVARADGSRHDLFPIAITAAEGEALRSWVTREGAARTIEIGLGYGLSALFIGKALLSDVSARHVAVDPYQTTRFADCGLQFLDDAGLGELIEFYPEESQIVLPRFLAEGRIFDLAFVDGNHRFERVFLDFIYLGWLVRPGGILFVDDYQLPAIARAAGFCVTNLGWTLEEVSTADELHQWAILRTSSVPDTRSFDHFVDF
jgi:predicted O-methyltransferase YrrM